MTKEQFKELWESNDDGGGITFQEIAECCKEWGISQRPMTQPISLMRYKVLVAAGCIDAESFNPDK